MAKPAVDLSREQRLTGIITLLGERGTLTVADVTAAFGVSAATARRDLDLLSERRLLHRTHGGAEPANTIDYSLTKRMRAGTQRANIAAIAAKACEMIAPGSTVGLSGGRTSTALAHEIMTAEKFTTQGLTVVTNAINIAQMLVVRPYLRVVVTGGIVRQGSYELAGPFSNLILEQITLDAVFLGANGFSASVGATVTEDVEAPINRLMASRAQESWIIADATKIGKKTFAVVGQPEHFTGVITSANADAAELEALKEAGLTVITV